METGTRCAGVEVGVECLNRQQQLAAEESPTALAVIPWLSRHRKEPLDITYLKGSPIVDGVLETRPNPYIILY
jgi:hypothetical protein